MPRADADLAQDTTDSDLSLPTATGGSMAKYNADQLRTLLKKGQAMANAKGEPSYPIADEDDLAAAIHAVGRGGKSGDAIRQYIIRRAKALGKASAIPETWNADGSLSQEDAVYDGDYRVEPDGTRVFDPDHDGDDDSTADGDTDHDYVQADGSPGPKARSVRSEGRSLSTVLVLEGELPGPVILQEANADNGNKMRVRVPFYIGESIARAPGFDRRVYFPRTLLPGIVQEGKAQIAEGRQPLNVYARHAHADGDHLPVGAVVDLEAEGRIGYATLEVSPTTTGRDVQVLIANRHLNAVSLRSGLGRFELEDTVVNGESMLTPKRLAISGVDFAPDSPAQPTYGIEVLQEAPHQTAPPPPPTPTRRKPQPMPDDELTLATLRASHPALVAEIEAPIRIDLGKMTQDLDALKSERVALLLERDTIARERDGLVQERNVRSREAKLREIAAQCPDPDKALPVLQELCRDCTTDAEVAAAAFPVLLEALGNARKTVVATKPPKEALLELFRIGGGGQPGLSQEDPDQTKPQDPADFAGISLAEA